MRTGPLHQAEIALGTAAVAVTAPVYGAFFVGRGYLLPLLVAAAGGATMAVLAALTHLRHAWTAVAVTGGFLVVAVYAVLPGTLRYGIPTGTTLSTLGTGVSFGWIRMLTVGVPADVRGELLITPALVLYLCGFAAAQLSLRTRSLFAPAAVPPLALLAALPLTAGRTAGAMTITAVMLLAGLTQVLIRAVRTEGAEGGSRLAGRALFGLPVVVAVVAAGTGFAKVAPIAGHQRFDPRTVVPVPLTIEDTINPLAALKSRLREKNPPTLFTVRGSGLDRVRTAVLDTYDGAEWTSHDRFLLAGHELAPGPGTPHGVQVGLHVRIDALEEPYLPEAGWPEQITGSGIGYAVASGVLATPAKDRHGLSYDLVATVRPRDAGARTARPFVPSPRYLALPADFPVELRQEAQTLTAGTAGDYPRLVALETRLRALRYDPATPPGHSLHRLRGLFGLGTNQVAGYAEQHAAAFAVLARSLGYPARVATGYLLRRRSPAHGVYTVRSTDAYAWAEVSMAGYGWMAFDPTNPDNRHTPAPPPNPVPKSQPQVRPGDVAPSMVVRPDLAAPVQLSPWDWALIVAAALVALAILLPVLVVAEKQRRTRRRRRGTPAQRISGAWRESSDRLREAGVPIHRAWTVLETADHARRRLGDTTAPVATLAPLVGAALYAAEPPAAEAAEEAWRADAALRSALRRERGLPATMAAWIDPRPILIRDRSN
ncbi:hypothetical protein ACWT_2107 [Actinoplanes sp. SE50]|uniref:transglutaminase family protein n=1 Tax=unclassified Actinoplanes TaxID=2626549 RepID=UPI00023EC915|nr:MULTISPECIES: transglutaminase domain-containing protein [unclassified Actinoplanes]AEV83127.1 yebA-like uncharacterized protein [Actinoplanes sp. SE50/110]ATO81522.1 hypothetical protein ACWT_2107 [Actinoplanes sp. SE50]SLL98929.1 hypothetical protein ACSP50_2156 [Actinoplanes sp. SE50/110]